jgi:hypothetical protein
MYIGQLPQHSRSVALILDGPTGLVSPQFHFKFDPSFHTVKQDKFDSIWQTKAGFDSQREPKKDGQNPTTKMSTQKVRWDPQPEGARDLKKRCINNAPSVSNGTEVPAVDDELSLQHHHHPVPQADPKEQTPVQDANPEEPPAKERPKETISQSGRISRPAKRLIQVMMAEIKLNTQGSEQVEGKIFSLQTMFPEVGITDKDPLLAYKATSDRDTIYLHEAMKEPDKADFIKAVQKEVQDQMDNGNYSILHQSELPKGATVLPAVWQMKRKRNIMTQQVKKWKAWLNIKGSRMKKGIHYKETYVPVATWNSIRLLLTLTAVH